MSDIFFSIVIPTKNRNSLLHDLIEGLKSQTFDPNLFEVIIVDDGSRDHTVSYLRSLKDALPFRLIVPDYEPRNGPAPARNFGARLAIGRYLAFTDSDCRPHPNWLKNAYLSLHDESVDFAAAPVHFKPEQVHKHDFFSRKTVTSPREHPTYPTSNIFYRRSLFLSVSGFDETLSYPASHGFAVEGADTDLAWRLIERGAKKLFIEDALIYHEVQKQGVDAWLIEPWRLYIVPALIKLHPRLRQKMLVGQFFFYRNSLYYYILSILVIVLLVVSPHILLWTPVALLAIAFIKTRSISPITLFRELVKITLNTIRNYIMITALLYGSIRFRTMVL